MKEKARLARINLIRRTVSYDHTHLGAPEGFGKTLLLGSLYRHFMRSGRGARRGVPIDAARTSLRSLDALFPPPVGMHTVVAIDNATPEHEGMLRALTAEIEKKRYRIRILSAGVPLRALSSSTLHLGMEDLAFTREEAETLAPGNGERILELTGGWPFPFACLAVLPPYFHERTLDDPHSPLRGWLRGRAVLFPPEMGEKMDFLTRCAALQRLDERSLGIFEQPKKAMDDLRKLERYGCPLLSDGEALTMHPLLRRCLQNDLRALPDADAVWNKTIGFYVAAGEPLSAAQAACESGNTTVLAEILEKLEPEIRRVTAPEAKQKFATWVDHVVERHVSLTSRPLSLAARIAHMAGEAGRAQRLAEEAICRARTENDSGVIIRNSILLARILRCRFSLGESDAILEEVREEFPGMTWPLRYEACSEYAYNRIIAGEYRKALSLMDALRKDSLRAGHPKVAAQAERFMTLPFFYMGRYIDALRCFEAAKNLPPDDRFLLDRHGVHAVAAKCRQIRGEDKEARVLIEEQLAMKKFSDDPDDHWFALGLSAEIAFSEEEPELHKGKGDLSRVTMYLEELQELLSENLENVFFRTWYQAYSSIFKIFFRPDEAFETAKEGAAKARACSPFFHAMLLARGASYSLIFMRDPSRLPEIVKMLYRCLHVCRKHESQVFESVAHAILASIYDSFFLKEKAEKHMRAAFAHFEREGQFGVFRTPEEMRPLVQLAWERGVAPDFLEKVIARYGYSPRKWRAQLFGRFEIVFPNGKSAPSPVSINRMKVRELFAYLLHNGGRAVTRKKLLEDLWPGVPPEKAHSLCKVTLSQCRRVLEDLELAEAFTARNGKLHLDTSGIATDAEGLEKLERILSLLPLIGKKSRDLLAEFERLRLTPLRRGYLGEFASPWAREAAQEIDALIERQIPPPLPVKS